jgi:hypothetical protein
MSNRMQLRYKPSFKGSITTEEEVFELFKDIRKHYETLREQATISTKKGEHIDNFRQFLENAVRGRTVLISGLALGGKIPVDVEYDLSRAYEMIEDWYTEMSGCHTCKTFSSRKALSAEDQEYCKKMRPGTDCDRYLAVHTNSEGKPARKLNELIEEAA